MGAIELNTPLKALSILAIAAVAGSSQALGLYNYGLDTPTNTTNATVKFNSVNPQASVTVKVNGGANQTFNAGVMNLTVNGQAKKGFCVDLEQNANGNNQNYNQTDYFGQLGALVSQLTGSLTNDQAAGLQIAIWELAYDHIGGNTPVNVNLAAGNFILVSTTAGATTAAQNYLAALGANSAGNYRRWYSDTYQDYIESIPEPGTILALGMGAAALAARRRRKA